MAGGKHWDMFKMEKLEDYIGKEVNVCVKESTAWFSGRNCDLDHIDNHHHNFNLKLEKVTMAP